MGNTDSKRVEGIWRAADAMRGAYRPDEVTDALLTALYLRAVCGHRRWQRLVDASYPRAPQFRSEVEHALQSSANPEPLPRADAEWFDTALRDAIQQIEPVFGGAPTQDEIGEAFSLLLDVSSAREARYAGENTTPPALRRLMVRIAAPSGGRVYDPAAGVGGLLVEAARFAGASVEVMGQELNERVRRIGAMHLRVNQASGEILAGDTLQADRFQGLLADCVLATPPFGLKWDRSLIDENDPRWRGIRVTRNADLAWLQHCAFHLADGGVAVVALPLSSTFAGGRDQEVRRDLLSSGLVRSVISLPPRVFASTGISLALWVLQRGERSDTSPVLLVNASAMGGVTAGGPVTFGEDEIAELAALVGAEPPMGIGEDVEAASNALWVSLDSIGRREWLLDPNRYIKAPVSDDVQVDAEPAARLLSSLALTNFKAFRDTQVAELAPLTLIYGQNSAGKSSLFHALLMLKQTLQTGGSRSSGGALNSVVTQGPWVDLGTLRGVLNRHQADATMEVGISFGATRIPEGAGHVPTSFLRHLTWRVTSSPSGGPMTDSVMIGLGDELRVNAFSSDTAARQGLATDDESAAFLLTPEDAQAVADFISSPEGRLVRARSRQDVGSTKDEARASRVGSVRNEIRRLLRDMQGLGFPVQGQLLPMAAGQVDLHISSSAGPRAGYAQTAVRDVGLALATPTTDLGWILAGLSYLGPLRSPPARFTERSVDAQDVGPAGENVASILDSDPSLLEAVNGWLTQLQIPYRLRVARLADSDATGTLGDLLSLVLTDSRSGADVSPLDVGFGISQLLPVVVHLVLAHECVTCIEQPEIHVHPRLQTEMADLLIDTTKEETGNQVIVETHSEHLLLRIQRRMRAGVISPEQVSVLYVDQDETGAARIRRLRLDTDGSFLDPWPHGFFAERLDELFGDDE